MVLPPALEDELVEYIRKMEQMFFGLTTRDVRRLAYQLAEKNGLNNTFNKEKKIAGKDWYYCFMGGTQNYP